MHDLKDKHHVRRRRLSRPWVISLSVACAVCLMIVPAGCDAESYVPPETEEAIAASTTTTTRPITTTTTASPTTTTAPSMASSTTTTSVQRTTTTVQRTTTTRFVATTTTEAIVTPDTVLYEITDWSVPNAGWALTGQWKTVGAMLVTDGSEDSIAVAPVDLRDHADYAVEAEIQVIDPGRVNCFLEARLINGQGYYGGYRGYWEDMEIGFGSNKISAADFSINTDWHTYRFEVRQNTMTLYFDGAEVVRAMDNRQLQPGTVGIFCSGQINVRAFRVTAL